MRGRIIATVAVLLAFLGGVAAATDALCDRTCSFGADGIYRCVSVCASGTGRRPGPKERRILCRKRCRAELRACQQHVDAVFACPKRAGALGRACRQTAKRALRGCRADITAACMAWRPRPRGCPAVALEASGTQRLLDRSDPTLDYVLVDVALRSRGDAAITHLVPEDFALIAGGETFERRPLTDLAGVEYCAEDMTLPANGTVRCRLAYRVPSGTSSAAIEFANDPYRGSTSVRVPAPTGPAENRVRLGVQYVAMLPRLGEQSDGSGGQFALVRIELRNAGPQVVVPEARHFRFEIGTQAYAAATDVPDDEVRAVGGEPCPNGRSPVASGAARVCMLVFRIPLGTERGRVAYDDGTHRGAADDDTIIPVLRTQDRSQALTVTLTTRGAGWTCPVDLTHVPTFPDGPAFLLRGPCSEGGIPRAALVLWGPADQDGHLRVEGAASPLCDLLRTDAAPLPVAADDPDPPPTGGYSGTFLCTLGPQTTPHPFSAVPR